jgi:hypothetical protein
MPTDRMSRLNCLSVMDAAGTAVKASFAPGLGRLEVAIRILETKLLAWYPKSRFASTCPQPRDSPLLKSRFDQPASAVTANQDGELVDAARMTTTGCSSL